MTNIKNDNNSLNDFLPGGKMTEKRTNLIGMDMTDLQNLMSEIGQQPFRAKQVYSWIYAKGAMSVDNMTNLSKEFREEFNTTHLVGRPKITSHQISTDGTQKWLLKYIDGNEAETVYIPETDRGTLCISSQVGCTLTCKFCHTGTQRLVRNLTAGEIVSQIMIARDAVEGWKPNGEKRKISNIVFMGMGEPLYNTDNVIKALKVITAIDGISISKRKVTVSTSGVADQLERLGTETNASLAISLHAPDDETRTKIMPINKKYNLKQLMDICRQYPKLSNTNRITWEYVMLKGINDSKQQARDLAKLIKDIPSKVNLIPFNPWEGSTYECSDADTIELFAQELVKHHIPAPIRRTRGEDIMAACGQLKSESERIAKYKLREQQSQ